MNNIHTVEAMPLSRTNRTSTSFDLIKPKLNAPNDRERVAYVEEYLASKDVQSATKVSKTTAFNQVQLDDFILHRKKM